MFNTLKPQTRIALNKAHEVKDSHDMVHNFVLLAEFSHLLRDVKMTRSLKELCENVGWRMSMNDENGETLRHGLTDDDMNALWAIRRGDLDTLVELGPVQVYKDVNIRLAILHGHLNVMRYLWYTNQVNRSVNDAIGECASVETFERIMEARLLPEMYTSLPSISLTEFQDLSDREKARHVSEWYDMLKTLDLACVYASAKRYDTNLPLVAHMEATYPGDVLGLSASQDDATSSL
jgi:hypothetical protein